MSDKVTGTIHLGIRIVVSLAFVAAGLAKLFGAAMMVATFEAVGFGQWFRYLTGFIEVGGAILLWLPGRQYLGAGLLLCTMIGASMAHIVVLGTETMVPAVVLGILSAVLLWRHRAQILA
jgi:uncharacterized membrane protein YphA (DoxX/SURF4 family)